MCNTCQYKQYCEDCKAELPVFAKKPSHSRVVNRKKERATRVIFSGDVVYIKGRPFQMNHNIEIAIKKGGKNIFALSKDKKLCFHFRKHKDKLLLLQMRKRNFQQAPNKKPDPTPETLLIGRIDSEKYLNLANGFN